MAFSAQPNRDIRSIEDGGVFDHRLRIRLRCWPRPRTASPASVRGSCSERTSRQNSVGRTQIRCSVALTGQNIRRSAPSTDRPSSSTVLGQREPRLPCVRLIPVGLRRLRTLVANLNLSRSPFQALIAPLGTEWIALWPIRQSTVVDSMASARSPCL